MGKDNQTVQASLPAPETRFKGYTLQELRYQRAMVALHKEFCRSKLTNGFNRIRNRSFLNGVRGASSGGSWIGKFMSGLNVIDYIVLSISIFSSIRKFLSLFKRKKR